MKATNVKCAACGEGIALSPLGRWVHKMTGDGQCRGNSGTVAEPRAGIPTYLVSRP